MALPQLIDEDMQVLDSSLAALLNQCEAALTLLIDRAGFLITQAAAADAAPYDTTTMAALAAGSFAATQSIAQLIQEPPFTSVHQQGVETSLLVFSVDDDALLVVLFKTSTSVGMVKYYAALSVTQAADQLAKARQRTPGASVDFATMNLENSQDFFRRKPV